MQVTNKNAVVQGDNSGVKRGLRSLFQLSVVSQYLSGEPITALKPVQEFHQGEQRLFFIAALNGHRSSRASNVHEYER